VIESTAQTTIAGPELVPPIWEAFAGLLVVIALLVGLAWLVRRSTMRNASKRRLAIEGALPLGDRRSLAIVTVEGRRLLLGLAPNSVSLVTELSAAPPSFEDAVARALPPEARA